MVHVASGNGYYYLRESDGETVASFGKDRPVIYRPQLFQDKAENILARLPDNSVDLIFQNPS